MSTQPLDKFTRNHMLAWCEHQFPNESFQVYSEMAQFLMRQDESDRIYLLDSGYWKVFDAMLHR